MYWCRMFEKENNDGNPERDYLRNYTSNLITDENEEAQIDLVAPVLEGWEIVLLRHDNL